MNQSISVCPKCSHPVIFTFLFQSREWFCLKCKWVGAFLESDHVTKTPALQSQLDADKAFFAEHAQHIWHGGSFKDGCDRCHPKYHCDHLTDEEKELMHAAEVALGIARKDDDG